MTRFFTVLILTMSVSTGCSSVRKVFDGKTEINIGVVNHHTTHTFQITINNKMRGEIPAGQTRAFPTEVELREAGPTSPDKVAIITIVARDVMTNLQAVKKYQVVKADPLTAEFFPNDFK